MVLPTGVESIVGARELLDWFGYWPEFHDAEVIRFHLELGGPSFLQVHTWEMTNTVTAAGFYELRKHVEVEFLLNDVINVNLQDLREHSILLSLEITRSDSGFRLDLSSAYGLCGTIEAQQVSVRITPGKPSGTSASS
ncbi:MAG: Imm50 family immunity protein [Candidatus Sulfotelmatobacter sp.]